MTEIGRHDDVYRSTPLEQKLAWFQNAPGLSAVEPARDFMVGAAALYTDSDSTVRATLRGLGADWTGDAATNAGATLQRAANWSHDAGASHGIGGETVGGYGESFEFVRGQVHWDDPWAWGWNDTASAAASVATLNPAPFLGNLTSDYFTTAQQNRTNDVAAVAALRAHEEQTRNAVDTFPSICRRLPAGGRASAPTPAVATPLTIRPPRRCRPREARPAGVPSAGALRGRRARAARRAQAFRGGPGGSAPGAGVPGIVPGVVPTGPAGAGVPAERQARAAQEARQRARIPAVSSVARYPAVARGPAVRCPAASRGRVERSAARGRWPRPRRPHRRCAGLRSTAARWRRTTRWLACGSRPAKVRGGSAAASHPAPRCLAKGRDGSAVAPRHSPAKGPDASASGAVSRAARRADGGT